jgi:hypothetical protein
MAEYPDFFADGFSLTVGPFGVVITFQLSQPTLEPGPHVDEGIVIGRARMTPALAKALAQGLNDAVSQQATVQAPEPNVRH